MGQPSHPQGHTLSALDALDQRLSVALDARDATEVAELAAARGAMIARLVKSDPTATVEGPRLRALVERHAKLQGRIEALLGDSREDLGRVRRHRAAAEKYHRLTTLETP